MAKYLTYNKQELSVGDTVAVMQEVVEGGKKRVQTFEGVMIAVGGRGVGKTFTVRKISGSVAVEKIFPVSLPTIKDVTLKRQGEVRRAKLYYLRGKIGRRQTKIKEKSVNAAAKDAKASK